MPLVDSSYLDAMRDHLDEGRRKARLRRGATDTPRGGLYEEGGGGGAGTNGAESIIAAS